MAKICKQKEHKWELIQQFPYRCKCIICGTIGKMYKKSGSYKILPINI
jgi:hypothetical protein